ncbi:very-short-patch-repair endonuclease [Glaciihabitans tibetensis]|uniref:Very-short-patch-repair endonuclease n=1 Tax=Glaciihabitans tibetensis TaxID=1266600 RepID=A0A2T0VJ45_9MICO|nr:glycyl-tRNA synthetase [Glaciihabitans tibetensis]PRY70241.1 very-short-patch-repair endonuclease [Glaciihabitans tibetensis]
MSDIAALVDAVGGVAHKRQLVALGARDHELTRAVRNKDVIRVRQGWYSTLPPTLPELRAVRIGGRLTGISAIAAAGGWVLDTPTLHVSVPKNAARLRSPVNRFASFAAARTRGVRLHWDAPRVGRLGTVMRVGLLDALERVVLDETLEVAVAALDWALHTRHIDSGDLDTIFDRLPAIKSSLRGWIDPKCESLPESLARTRLRLRGHHVISQARVGENQRIDMVVDGVVALETDGEEHHRDRFHADRAKDLTMTIHGYHALRATAVMVFRDWGRVAAAIESALLGRGVSPPRPLSMVRGRVPPLTQWVPV